MLNYSFIIGDSSYHSSNIPFPILKILNCIHCKRGIWFSFLQSSLKHSSSCPVHFGYQVHGLLELPGYQVHSLWILILIPVFSFIPRTSKPTFADLRIFGYFLSLYSNVPWGYTHRTFYHYDLYFGAMVKMELLSEAYGLLLYGLDTSLDIPGYVFHLYENSITSFKWNRVWGQWGAG